MYYVQSDLEVGLITINFQSSWTQYR